MKKWLFNDDPNVAVITTKNILSRKMDITRVFHDSDDGMWQFLDSSEDITENDAVIVGLKEIVDLDKTINELHTLPLGWSAYRDDKNSNWMLHRS
ncbi:hypothetical protein EQP59_03760 [Ornithobacterium rhinotracheale]|uniref:DUF2185 domain-containing protein n=1 Tax=Ornithobacterium rhinotracheale TaxID=28251 RepID=A0A410JQV4_ORNRH|nr:hypothetical protein [Ornithobacterium rhinotracheale]MRJ10949.1 hypothetical protein [Ornithobacterium rhinotracheale]QAR30532.1 hypothetical protein EQP59_03760 [Ornithobacterium rhinotracheale]